MRIYVFYILTILAVVTASAQVSADSVSVYFPIGQSQFNPAYDNNGAVMNSFIDRIRQNSESVERIVVRGYASPDGMNQTNRRLSQERCETISRYIEEKTGLSADIFKIEPMGIAWDELRRAVEATPEVPAREKVLDVLDNVPVLVYDANGRIVDGRKKRLMEVYYGRSYKWMMEHIFPELRKAVAVKIYLKQPEVAETNTEDDSKVSEESKDSNSLNNFDNLQDSNELNDFNAPAVSSDVEELSRHHFALKTNLLYDAALMPNLEFEWLINDRWSVSLEGDVAWWKLSDTKIYRLAVVLPEVRYHINPRGLWHGMYVGAFVGGGLYQLENGGNGYRGEGGMGGVSLGYMWPISKSLSFDAEIGAGYMFTRYKEYEPAHGHKVYLLTKSLNYFGPLKLKFSLVWRFDIVSKTAKVNSTL